MNAEYFRRSRQETSSWQPATSSPEQHAEELGSSLERCTRYCQQADEFRVHLMKLEVTPENQALIRAQAQDFEKIYLKPLTAFSSALNDHSFPLEQNQPSVTIYAMFEKILKEKTNRDTHVFARITELKLEVERLTRLFTDYLDWKKAHNL